MSRETFIQSAIDRGASGEDINASLGRLKYDPLTRAEIQQINEGSYGLSGLQRFKKEAGDYTKGAATMIGQGIQAITHPIKEGLPLLQKVDSYLAKDPSLIRDFSDLLLNPYNLTVEKALSQSPVESAKDIATGIYNHPFTFMLDTLPFTAPLVGKGIQKGIKALPDSKVKTTLRGLIPEGANVNRILSEAKATTADTIENLRNASFRLQQYAPEDLAVAIKNIEAPNMGKWSGTEQQLAITKELRDMVNKTNELLVKAGANPEMMKNAAVNQYIVRTLGTDTPIATVEKALQDKKFALENGLEPQKLKQLQEEGTRLYNEKLIQPFKHSTDADMVREGLVEESLKKQRSANAKLYGTQSYEDLAKGFIKDGYTNTINKLRTTEGAMAAIRNMADEVARKVDNLEGLKLEKSEVLVSPRLLNEKFGTSIANGEDIIGDINSLSRGLNKAERAKYADDLYIFNKQDIEALKKAYNPRSGVLNDLGSIAKMGVLATPRYIAGNALTNIMIAPITGVGIRDVLYTLQNIDKLPAAIKRSTAYSGYLGERLPLSAGYKDIYKQLGKDITEGDALKKLSAINMGANYPIFKTAQIVETFQRAVEFVNQARKYAKENGKTFEQIMREAKKNGGNNRTYREIQTRVQQYLGDYMGRNYYLPDKIQTAMELSTPFYRPITQGIRQFYNATKDYPLGTQAFYRQPALASNEYAQQLANEMGVERDPVYGGYPIKPKSGKIPGQVIYSPYHAFSIVGELVQDPINVLAGNTFAASPILPILGRNKFGERGKLPNSMESFDGNLVMLDNNGNPTGIQLENNIPARIGTLAGQYGQQFISPITQANNYILPLLALTTGQTYKAPADTALLGQVGDLRLPFIMESNMGARPKSDIDEILLPMIGGTIRNTYKEKTGEVKGKQYKRYSTEMRKRINRLKWER